MTMYGYARVSTRDQDLAGQVAPTVDRRQNTVRPWNGNRL